MLNTGKPSDIMDPNWSSSVLPLHLVDQVLLFDQGLLLQLLARVGQMFHDLLEHPIERMMRHSAN